jgi:hypothetical protein
MEFQRDLITWGQQGCFIKARQDFLNLAAFRPSALGLTY